MNSSEFGEAAAIGLAGRDTDASWTPPQFVLDAHKQVPPLSEEELKKQGFHRFVARSEQARRAATLALQYLAVKAPILIVAPSGCGKENLVRDLHDIHNRQSEGKNEFRTLSCAELNSDLDWGALVGVARRAATGVEQRQGILAHAGTGLLVLDEFHAAGRNQQLALLRLLDPDKPDYSPVGSDAVRCPVKAKIVACTSEDLWSLQKFNGPLLKRLQPRCVWIPPLHERPEDIAALCEQKLKARTPKVRFGKDDLNVVVELVVKGRWDGRILCKRLEDSSATSLPRLFPERWDMLGTPAEQAEYLKSVRARHDTNQDAANELFRGKNNPDAARAAFYRKLRKLSVEL